MERREVEKKRLDENHENRIRKEFLATGYSESSVEGIIAKKMRKDKEQSENALPVDKARPTWIRVHTRYLDSRTLDAYDLPWQRDLQNPDYIIITKYISPELQEDLFEHTKALKSRKVLEGPEAKEWPSTDEVDLIVPGSNMYVVKKKARSKSPARGYFIRKKEPSSTETGKGQDESVARFSDLSSFDLDRGKIESPTMAVTDLRLQLTSSYGQPTDGELAAETTLKNQPDSTPSTLGHDPPSYSLRTTLNHSEHSVITDVQTRRGSWQLDSGLDSSFARSKSVLKEPNLAKEAAGQGLISILSSYARGGMGMWAAAIGMLKNMSVANDSNARKIDLRSTGPNTWIETASDPAAIADYLLAQWTTMSPSSVSVHFCTLNREQVYEEANLRLRAKISFYLLRTAS